MARVWLTGQRGYLGECVHRCLVERGWQVFTVDGPLQQVPPASVRVDAVVHCAGSLRHRGDAAHDAGHVGATRAMLAALARPAAVVFASSRSVYGPAPQMLLDETAPCRPADAYGRAKLAAEQAIGAAGVPFTLLRLSTLVGAGVTRDGASFLRAAFHQAWRGEAVTRFCPDRLHDALDVWAAARGCVAALEAGCSGEVFNLAGAPRGVHASLAAMLGHVPQGRLLDCEAAASPAALLDSTRWRQKFRAVAPRGDAALFAAWAQWWGGRCGAEGAATAGPAAAGVGRGGA